MEQPRTWRKSSYTTDNNCVEVAFASTDVGVPDSKQPTGPALEFGPEEWRVFIGCCLS
jgi:Domain of unknown function (DUF397)